MARATLLPALLGAGLLLAGPLLVGSSLGCRKPGEAAAPAASPAVSQTREPDPAAEQLMRRVEERERGTPRIVRLDVATERAPERVTFGYPAHEETQLWGVVDGDPRHTRMLFVFCEPRRMRGTGLMIEDIAGAEDALGYHMRTFDRFKTIPRTSLKLIVPGTCLSYENARGFLSLDRYRFAWANERNSSGWAAGHDGGGDEARVVGWALDDALADDIGYARLEAVVDRQKNAVASIDYYDSSGKKTKTYRTEKWLRVGDAWLASQARIEDLQAQVISELRASAWSPNAAVPREIFDPSVAGEESLQQRAHRQLLALGVAEAEKLQHCGEAGVRQTEVRKTEVRKTEVRKTGVRKESVDGQ